MFLSSEDAVAPSYAFLAKKVSNGNYEPHLFASSSQ